MKRKFSRLLEQWNSSTHPKPLLVEGARQVGKTWLIRQFCQENFDHFIELNFEKNAELAAAFEGSLDPEMILRNLSILIGKPIDPEHTVLFMDEIQVCERAITSLKYFCESPVNYHVIGAGSLLGVKVHRFHSSFPVGKVELARMYPMDFEEFLDASGESLLFQAIRDSYHSMKPLPEGIHGKAIHLYQDYLYIGGMPEAVLDYLSCGKDVTKCNQAVQQNIINSYLADMSKYTLSAAESVKINQTYLSLPRQLAKENPKFQYKQVRSMANKRDFQSSLDWLLSSGLVLKSTAVSSPQSPLLAYEEEGIFRIYLSDTGLLSALSNISYRSLLMQEPNVFKGAVTENYVVQTLASAGLSSWYFKPNQSLGIDQLVQVDGRVVPLEIKSGRHKKSTSLNSYIRQYSPLRSYRISEHNFGISDQLYLIPLYALPCLAEDIANSSIHLHD